LALAAGGFPALTSALNHEEAAFAESTYGSEYETGPLYDLLRGFWILGPVNFVLSGFAVVLSCLSESRLLSIFGFQSEKIPPLRLFSLLTVFLILLILIAPTAQNFRYLTPIYGPMYLLDGIGAWVAVHLLRRHIGGFGYRMAVGGIAAIVLVSAIAGHGSFERVWVVRGVPDLSIKLVLDSEAI
jgi:hypothetical protein